MLDNDFLRSLGIKEELLLSALNPEEVDSRVKVQDLPLAGEKGVPVELLQLSLEDLEKLLREQYSQENPYIYIMPNGQHKMAVYPDEIMEKYDLELTIDEFINFVGIVSEFGLEAYKTRNGQCYYIQPNPSHELMNLMASL